MVGVFLFYSYRFPASTWDIGRGFVHFLYPYGQEVLAGIIFVCSHNAQTTTNMEMQINDDIKEYINDLDEVYTSKKGTEHTYRSSLDLLLKKLLCKNSITKKDKIKVFNEAKRQEYGTPDFDISREGLTISYIETKQPGDSDLKGKHANKAQFDRYKRAISTIAFTDYMTFLLYENEVETAKATLAKIENGHIVAVHDDEQINCFKNIVETLSNAEPQKIRSATVLANIMAAKAKVIANILQNAMKLKETKEDKDLICKQEDFKKVLVHNMTEAQFADFYAQTIVYGLFIGRVQDSSPDNFSLQKAAELIPTVNPFLKKIFSHLALADQHTRIKWVVEDLVVIFRKADMSRIMNAYRKDPVVHFYEDFLKAYNPEIKKQYGVWNTPVEVVRFIVNMVDDILKTKLDLPEGLANNDLIDGQQYHKVQILDPATGTGTFLAETADKIHAYKTYQERPWEWQQDVVNHIIPRLNGFEYLMAPYTMAHLKLAQSLRLEEVTGKQPERLNIFLTNSLDDIGPQQPIPFAKYVTEESNAAYGVKNRLPVMVVMGNPPYNEKSANNSVFIQKLIADYKQEPGKTKTICTNKKGIEIVSKKGKVKIKNTLAEGNPKGIDNDYCKFIRLGQHYVDAVPKGVLAYICGNTFLDTNIFRGMRYELLKAFDEIYIINLHGSQKRKESKDDRKDENVFNITVGVSINIFIKKEDCDHSLPAKVFYKDIYDTAENKKRFLSEISSLEEIDFQEITPFKPYYTFGLRDQKTRESYDDGFRIDKLMKHNAQGFKTDRDNIARQFDEESIVRICQDMRSDKTNEDLINIYGFIDNRDWNLAKARKKLKKEEDWHQYVTPFLFHPFDCRWTLLNKALVTYPRLLLEKSVFGKNNTVLCLGKAGSTNGDKEWSLAYITDKPTDMNAIPRGGVYLFPLFVFDDEGECHINLNSEIVNNIECHLHLKMKPLGDNERSEGYFLPIDIIDYIYAVLHSRKYRKIYHECLQDGFPSIPYPKDLEYFFRMVSMGERIRQLHFLKGIEPNNCIAGFKGYEPKDMIECSICKFEQVGEDIGRVWINGKHYFDSISLEVWNLEIAGFQPIFQWLKERKGRVLSNEDIRHVQRMSNALNQQIDIMRKIDNLILI